MGCVLDVHASLACLLVTIVHFVNAGLVVGREFHGMLLGYGEGVYALSLLRGFYVLDG